MWRLPLIAFRRSNLPAQWTCIVLAGQRPGPDRLADHFGVRWKALVSVGGEPMLTRVIRTLHSSPSIGEIIVLGQDVDALKPAVDAGGGATIVQSADGISLSVKKCIEDIGFASPALVTAADHPLLTAEMIQQFLDEAGGDVAVAMVERQVMLGQFPDARRTWLRFSDGAWSGANLFALMSPKAMAALDLWADAEGDRKNAWKLFLHFGIWLAVRAITRTIGLKAALALAGRRLGIEVQLVPMSDPVAAIDVDKVSDYHLAEKILAGRN
jgi:GTP:adenosylcobinamide-phosphate guanylyltransferase